MTDKNRGDANKILNEKREITTDIFTFQELLII